MTCWYVSKAGCCWMHLWMWATYGVHVWGLTFPSFLSQLFIIQEKAIRIISFSDLKSHSEPNCSNFSTYLSSMMSLNYRYSLLFISGHTDCYPPPPSCFSEYFKFTYFVHSYSTRQLCKRNLYVSVASVNTTQYGFTLLKIQWPSGTPWPQVWLINL